MSTRCVYVRGQPVHNRHDEPVDVGVGRQPAAASQLPLGAVFAGQRAGARLPGTLPTPPAHQRRASDRAPRRPARPRRLLAAGRARPRQQVPRQPVLLLVTTQHR